MKLELKMESLCFKKEEHNYLNEGKEEYEKECYDIEWSHSPATSEMHT